MLNKKEETIQTLFPKETAYKKSNLVTWDGYFYVVLFVFLAYKILEWAHFIHMPTTNLIILL